MTSLRRISPARRKQLAIFEKKFTSHYERDRHEIERGISALKLKFDRKEISRGEMLSRIARLKDKLIQSHSEEAREMHGFEI